MIEAVRPLTARISDQEGKRDSALYFFNSGIDFVIEQKPHYYFRLFELSLQLGEYGMLKHNLKHFKKLYGKQKDLSPYEEEYPYTYADFEYYLETSSFLYNYSSWKPLWAALMLNWSLSANRQIFALKLLVALTFIGHACFALGVNYVPDGFIKMTTAILSFSKTESMVFLFTVGLLDVLAALLIFINKRLERLALYYLIAWGLITALARLVYPLFLDELSLQMLVNGFLGMFYRLPHALIPLLLYFNLRNNWKIATVDQFDRDLSSRTSREALAV